MKKTLLIALLIFLQFINVNALELNSKYAVLYNLAEDKPVLEVNKDEITSVASLTKIMTVYTAIKNIKDFNEKVILKNSMFAGLKEENAYVVGLKNNQSVTYNDLLYATLLASGADATRALVISISGSEEEFVKLMNNEVKKLNLINTHFTNAIGLDDETHYSTVDDIAKILKVAYQNEKFKEIFKTENYKLSSGNITVKNSMKNASSHYNLDVKNIIGAKTGYTGNAGRCLASIAYDKENDIEYLLVTTNAKTIKEPIIDAINIYNEIFKTYKNQVLIEKNSLLVKIPTKYSNNKYISFYLKEDLTKYLKNDYDKNNVKVIYNGEKLITPKMSKNKKLGTVKIYYNNELIKKENIVLKEKIEFSLKEFLFVNKEIIVSFIMSFILIFLAVIFILKKLKK